MKIFDLYNNYLIKRKNTEDVQYNCKRSNISKNMNYTKECLIKYKEYSYDIEENIVRFYLKEMDNKKAYMSSSKINIAI